MADNLKLTLAQLVTLLVNELKDMEALPSDFVPLPPPVITPPPVVVPPPIVTPPAKVRGRPRITGAGIFTDTGKPIRGCSMDIRKQAVPVCTLQSTWDNYRKAGINISRLDVKTDADSAGRSLQQQLPFIDAAVGCAEKANMYVQIHPSTTPGRYNILQLNDFWTAVASRYANRTHVVYEMYNEPTSNASTQYWGDAGSWTDTTLRDFRNAYDIIRDKAPDTHVILFSSANLAPNASAWRSVPERFDKLGKGPMDWNNVSIGFHFYPGTYKFGDPNGFGGLQALRDLGYKLWMTECNDFMPDTPSHEPRNSQQVWLWMEQFGGMPWNCLDGKGGNISTQITSKILPYLKDNGFPTIFE